MRREVTKYVKLCNFVKFIEVEYILQKVRNADSFFCYSV